MLSEEKGSGGQVNELPQPRTEKKRGNNYGNTLIWIYRA